MSTRKDSIFKIAKGYRGRAKNCFRLAIKSVEKGLQKAYRERRLRKREARSTQILQVGAGTREHGLSYSQFIHGLFQADIGINRKMLAVLAQQEPYSFRAIVEEAKKSLRLVVLGSPTDEAMVKKVAPVRTSTISSRSGDRAFS